MGGITVNRYDSWFREIEGINRHVIMNCERAANTVDRIAQYSIINRIKKIYSWKQALSLHFVNKKRQRLRY